MSRIEERAGSSTAAGARRAGRPGPQGERDTRAPVLEVFASIQGEGHFVGQPQVFLRLWGCPLRCRWCDTPGSHRLPVDAQARIELPGQAEAGGGRRREDAWASPFQAATWVAAAEPGRPRPVSLTGGEPLVWPGFVRELARYVHPRRVHLETAGAHPLALEQVLDAVDHVSLDLKLPADLDAPFELAGASEPAPRDSAEWAVARARTLELVRGRDAAAKLIVAGGRVPADYRALLDDVASIAPELPLYVQPVTPVNGVAAPAPELLLALVEAALERGLAARVVPQIHRALGLP